MNNRDYMVIDHPRLNNAVELLVKYGEVVGDSIVFVAENKSEALKEAFKYVVSLDVTKALEGRRVHL